MRIFCAEKGFGNKGLKGKGKAVARLGGMLLAGLLFAACQKDAPPVPEPEPDPTPDPVTVEYLRPNTTTAHQMKISQTGQELYQIVTEGEDPYVYTHALSKANPADSVVLIFEYRSPQGVDFLQVFLCAPVTEERSNWTKALEATSEWKTWSYNLYFSIRDCAWGRAGDYLRLDFGNRAGVSLDIRNLRLRGMTAEEKKEVEQQESEEQRDQAMETRLKDYLSRDYPEAGITSVQVGGDQVAVQGYCPAGQTYALAEIPPYQDVTESSEFPFATPVSSGTFSATLDRWVERDGMLYDRALSKWAVILLEGEKETLASHARYADQVGTLPELPPLELSSKKGLGGFHINPVVGDLDELGITSVTVNILPTQQMFLSPQANAVAHRYGGKTYYFSESFVQETDERLALLQEKNIVVAAILLIPPASAHQDPSVGALMQHPSFDPSVGAAHYTMPNLTTPESVNCYAAALDFLATRYGSDQSTHGKIHKWILHNEVDCGRDWTNMGNKPVRVYTDTYLKSMRMCYHIVRQYDARAEVMISLTHSWTHESAQGYSSRNILNLLNAFCRREGDFRWGVAYHPYPQDLNNPRTWEDPEALFSMSTPYVTFKNLEVLDRWSKQPENLYKGTQKRSVWLSENGTNSRTYQQKDLEEQAAGFAYAWKKIKALEGIDGIQWHNWIDNRQEEGLRIGLRKFPDEPDDPYGAKPVWYLYRAAGTAQEEEAFEPYLAVIGLSDWDIVQENIAQ